MVPVAVPLDQRIDVCAFNGDMDKIEGYLYTKDCCNEATEIREDPPELPPRSIWKSCSPAKEGEDAEEKLLNETIKNNNAKLLGIYERWRKKSQGLDSRLHETRQFRTEGGQEGRPSAQPVGVAGHQN